MLSEVSPLECLYTPPQRLVLRAVLVELQYMNCMFYECVYVRTYVCGYVYVCMSEYVRLRLCVCACTEHYKL